MSILDYLFDSNLKRREDIDELKKSHEELFQKQTISTNQGESIKLLQKQVSELTVLSKSLLTYIQQEPDFNQEQFEKVFREVIQKSK